MEDVTNHRRRHITIAFVDDDEFVRKGISRLARAHGFSCITFDSGESALAAVELDDADCLILDIQLSGIDGFETRDRLNARGFRRPVIFITAFPETGTPELERQLKGSECLYKPVEEDDLIAAIRRILIGR